MEASKVLQDIVQSAIGTKTHFDMWWAQANQALIELKDPFGDHYDFFAASYDAHYTAFLVYLAHIFDRRADSSSVLRYFELMGSRPGNPWNSEIESDFAELAKRARPLLIARHKTVAHIDAHLSEKDVFAPFIFTWDDARAVVDEVASLAMRLRGVDHPGEIGIPRKDRMKESLFKLLEDLRRARASET